MFQLNKKFNVTPNILFKLANDGKVLGIPRLLFVMLSGKILNIFTIKYYFISCFYLIRFENKR